MKPTWLGEWKICRKAIVSARDSIDLNEKQDDVEAAQALQQYHHDIMKSDKNNSNSKCSDESKNTKNMLAIPLSNNETTADDKDLKNEKNNKLEKEATGGKRAWKSPGVEEGSLDSRAQSLEIFRKHKREELRQEIILVEKFMNKMMILQPTENIVKTENSEAKKVMENFIADRKSVV